MTRSLTVGPTYQYASLFGFLYGVTVRSVVLGSAFSVTSTFSSDTVFIGGIIGSCQASSIKCVVENCVSTASVSHRGSVTHSAYVGGVVGHGNPHSYDVTERNCANYGVVTCTDRNSGMDALVWAGLLAR